MPLLQALNTISLWTLIVGLLAVFELYSFGCFSPDGNGESRRKNDL
jgi:hypothetical protein